MIDFRSLSRGRIMENAGIGWILHDGQSRALRIPKTYNVPGYPKGISGTALIRRMADHAVEYGVLIEKAEIRAAQRSNGAFVVPGWTVARLLASRTLRTHSDAPDQPTPESGLVSAKSQTIGNAWRPNVWQTNSPSDAQTQRLEP
jgi:thioredoxin reductase (NADPH)